VRVLIKKPSSHPLKLKADRSVFRTNPVALRVADVSSVSTSGFFTLRRLLDASIQVDLRVRLAYLGRFWAPSIM
jgi:hypothetical protein